MFPEKLSRYQMLYCHSSLLRPYFTDEETEVSLVRQITQGHKETKRRSWDLAPNLLNSEANTFPTPKLNSRAVTRQKGSKERRPDMDKKRDGEAQQHD